MEPEGSLAWLRLATCPYPEPHEPNPPHFIINNHFNIIHSRPGLLGDMFLSDFPAETSYKSSVPWAVHGQAISSSFI